MKTYSCKYCGEADLHWTYARRLKRRFLYRLGKCGEKIIHDCQEGQREENDISPGQCKYCGRDNLFWVKQANDKFQLTEEYGLQHVCEQFKEINSALREARRMDYAFEKKWINSHEDNYECTRCHGKGYCTRFTYTPRLSTYRYNSWPCKKCKRIGIFEPERKHLYLKALRKKYWPWKHGMKWSKIP